jgi:hypothetical protein
MIPGVKGIEDPSILQFTLTTLMNPTKPLFLPNAAFDKFDDLIENDVGPIYDTKTGLITQIPGMPSEVTYQYTPPAQTSVYVPQNNNRQKTLPSSGGGGWVRFYYPKGVDPIDYARESEKCKCSPVPKKK